MSLGSHIAKRGRAAFSASGGLFCAPREPLPFPYPQWIRTATTDAQDLTVGGFKNAPSVGHSHLSSNVHIPDLGFTAATRSPKYEELLEKLEQGDLAPIGETVSQSGHLARNSNNAMKDEAQQSFESNKTIETNQDSGDNSVIRQIASEGNFGPLPTAATLRRILAIKEKVATQRAYDKQVREEYEDQKGSERMGGEPNWRQILDRLERDTPYGAADWYDNILRIRVPFDAVGRLLFSEEYNIWAIKVRCGCQIYVSKADDASQSHRVILVSGTVHSITKAAAEILRAAPGAVPDEGIWSQQDPAFSIGTTRLHPSFSGDLKRFVRADKRVKMAAPIRADKVPRPPTWTPESFGLYVQSLTSIRMSTHMQHMLYGQGGVHTDAVVSTLQALFADPKSRTAISAPAFNDALAYLVKHSAINVVRDLYERMETQNLRMDTETFNILLRGAAKSRSLGNFQHILWLMLRRGYSPNADTWLAFMRAMENPQIKAHILKGMKKKELLHDPRIQQRVCEDFVDMEITTSLENDMDHEQFLAHMADRYGKNWLSTESANRLLYVLGSRGLISRCWDLLEFMHTKGINLSDVSIRTVLHHCEKQDNPQGAVEIMRRMSSLIGYEPCQDAYHALFNIAWEARLHCVARVVWRYACLNAATTYRMRKRIATGLQSPITHSSWTPDITRYRPRKEWAARACRFILGVPILPTKQSVSLSREVGDIRLPLFHGSAAQAPIGEFKGKGPSGRYVNKAEAFASPAGDGISSVEENSIPTKEDSIPAKGNNSPTGKHSNLGQNDIKLAEEDSKPGDKVTTKPIFVRALEKQFVAFHFWKPQRPFADVLVEAFEIDKVWNSYGGDHGHDRLEWLYMMAPQMPLIAKTLVRRRMPWDTAESSRGGKAESFQGEKRRALKGKS